MNLRSFLKGALVLLLVGWVIVAGLIVSSLGPVSRQLERQSAAPKPAVSRQAQGVQRQLAAKRRWQARMAARKAERARRIKQAQRDKYVYVRQVPVIRWDDPYWVKVYWGIAATLFLIWLIQMVRRAWAYWLGYSREYWIRTGGSRGCAFWHWLSQVRRR